MRNLFIAIFLIMYGIVGCVLGGAAVYYGDAWYFEKHTGGTELSSVYEAEKECEIEHREQCSMNGGFMPNSYFDPRKFPVDQGI